MIVVTGGAGFIGSNLVHALQDKPVIVVDHLKNGTKFKNIADCNIVDYFERDDFLNHIQNESPFTRQITTIFHQGACSTTTEWDGSYMMKNNYEYSKHLLHFCLTNQIPFIYASSAAVYGGSLTFKEDRAYEAPLNVYGYSKFQFDQYVRNLWPDIKSQVVGLRYFNVYGPREDHKGSMASVAYHLNNQLKQGNEVRLFEGSDGYANGEQRRDFIYVDDVVKVNQWFLANPDKSGIFNLGTGRSQTFNDVANAVIAWHKKGKLRYIPFPEHLQGCYQSFTQADITALRQAGYSDTFKRVEEGVKLYLDWLHGKVAC